MLLIKNALVYTMEPNDTPEKRDILVQDGVISAIGANLSAPDGTQVIDASGMVATPGLVDAHTHAGGFDSSSPDLNEKAERHRWH